MTGWTEGDRVEVDDEPGTVISSDEERTLVEMEDRTIDVPTTCVSQRCIDPDPDIEDGSHEWTKP